MKLQLIAIALLVCLTGLFAAGCQNANTSAPAAPTTTAATISPAPTGAAAHTQPAANATTSTQVQTAVSREQAESIALSHAGLTAEQVRLDRTEYDLEHGIPEYEVEFHHDGWEYDYHIHADTGEVLSYDISND